VAAGYAHIACCIDGSPCGGAALDSAVALWRASGGRLSLVHVGPYPLALGPPGGAPFRREDLNADAREWLRRRAGEIPRAEPVFLQGVRGPATCAWAEGADVDLIVVGAGSGRMRGLMPGPFVHELLEHAPCSVLVVRPGAG
jgi:nucleotide-binding universal stress UspA family protein